MLLIFFTNRLNKSMENWVEKLIARRYLLALTTLIITMFMSFGAQHASMEATDQTLLSEDDPYREEVKQAREDFPPTTGVLFAFKSGSQGVFNKETLTAMAELNRRFAQVKHAVSVQSLINFRMSAIDQDSYGRDYLVPALESVDEEKIQEIKSIALADEDLTKSILSFDGQLALANIRYKDNEDTQESRVEVADSILALRDSLRAKYQNTQVFAVGGPLFEKASLDSREADNMLYGIAFGLGLALFWICLKSFSFSIALLSIAAATFGATLGTYGWLEIPLNQISSLGPLVVVVVAIADGIHILAAYVQGLHQGLAKLDSMRKSLEINLRPVTLATITTAMGFLSLNYSSSPGIYGFGNLVAIGVCWAYVISIFLLPTLILLLPTNKIPRPLGVKAFIEQIKKIVANHGNLTFRVGAVIIISTLALLPLNKLDFDRFAFIDEESDFHLVYELLKEKIGNDQALAYSIDSNEYYGITQVDFLQEVNELAIWLDQQPEASFVTTYTDYLRSRNKDEHDDDEAYDRLPTDQLQIIDYLVGYQLIQEIEPSLQPIFNSDYSAVRFIVGTSNLSNRELIAFNERIDTWIADNISKKYKVLHGDNSILFARLNTKITVELLQGFSLSFAFITLTMIIGLKSLRYGLLSIIPNLFPATIVFGVWGLLVGELSPYILMLFSISIGLVVDDSVHVLSKYIRAKKDGLNPEEAVQYSLERAGSAITITTLALAIGTCILVFSSTIYFQSVAQMLTPIIVMALILDLFFLPPLLVKFDRWYDQRRTDSTPSIKNLETTS